MFCFSSFTSLKVTYIKRHLHNIKKKNRKKCTYEYSFDPIPTCKNRMN